ncbi:MAG TPA: translocation/assembly module TamB domain-containing protein [Desulfobaccales bacterium]
MLRRLRLILFTAALLLALGSQGLCGILPDAFWNWGGPRSLAWVQSKINGKLTAREIAGNPLTGLTFTDLVLTGPQGQVLLQAERLELRLALQSITALHPVIARLALMNPRGHLVQADGLWNFSDLVPPPAPGPSSQPPAGITGFLFREIEFSSLLVEHGELEITRDGVTRRYTDLDCKAAINLYHWGTPRRKLEVRGADLGVTTPQGRAQLNTGFTYSPSLVEIDSLALTLAGQPVLSLKGEICQPLKDLSCKLTGQLGPLQGQKIRQFWSRWPAPWDLDGKFSFSGTPKGMELTGAGGVGQAKFDLQGRLNAAAEPAVFELNLDLKGLATTQLQEVQGLEAGKIQGLSPVNAHLRLQGRGLPWNPENVQAQLNLDPFQYREVKVQRLELTLGGNAQGQDLHALLQGNFGALTVDSRGHLLPVGKAGPGASGDLTLKLAEFQPALLGLVKYAETSLSGTFAGKFRLPPGYSLAQAHLAGKLEAKGRLAGQPLDELRSQFALEGKKLHISEASFRLAALAATLRGDLTPAGLDIRFTAVISDSRGLPVPVPAAFAQLQAEGAVQGPWQEPRVNLTARGKKLSFQGVSLESASLSANLTGWPPHGGQVQLQGVQLRALTGQFSRLSLSARGEAGRWGFQMAATSAKYPQARLAGTADLRERPLVVLVNQLSWQDQQLTLKNRAPFQLRLLPGWEISPADFQVDGGLVTVQGLARGQEVSGRLEAKNLEANLLSPLGLPAQGKINGKLILAGSPRAPLLNGNLTLESGKIKDLPIQTLTTTLNYEAERLQLDGHLEESVQHSRLTWKGTVPVYLSLTPLRFALGNRDLYLRVQSERANLSLLTAISQEVQSAQASLDLLVEMRGDPHQPQISGHIRWGEGSLQCYQAGTAYHLAAGEIRLLGDKVVIPGIILTSDGTLRLAGDLELGGATAARLRAQADNFLLLNRGGNQIWTNGHVDLGGPFHALVATGHLAVPKGQFRPTFFRSEHDPDIVLVSHKPRPRSPGPAPAFYRNLRVDVTIESPGNVWLKDPIGQVEMTGKLKALKKPDQKLVFGGEIHALKGTVDVQEREFKVERAMMILPGVPGEPISVEGKAAHQMDEITLVLTVAGTVTNPQIRLESQPPLPPADVLAYLVFGAPTARLTKEQYFALGAQTLGVLGGITSKKIGELLGSSLPFLGGGVAVKSGMAGGRATMGVEKKITQDVSVSYQRNFNEERGQYERQVIIDYKINRNFSVESQLGTRNSGADVFFNYDF